MECLANIKFLDALDQPIDGLEHQLWVEETLISHNVTSITGESVWIKRPIGTIVDVRVKKITSGEYQSKVKIELIGEKTIFIVRSPKVLLKGVSLAAKDVASGSYVRSTYVVANGDYLGRIAAEHNTTTAELVRINNLKSDTDIRAGQILKLPPKKIGHTTPSTETKQVSLPSKQIEKTKIIVVQKNDTLSLIAKLTGNTVNEIQTLNKLTDGTIFINQKLKVYDREVTASTHKSQNENKQQEKASKPPKVTQDASKNKEENPVAKVEADKTVIVNGLLPEACGGEKHYKRTLARIAELHPIYQPYVIQLINTAFKELKICWMITDGYRSPSAQDSLPSANSRAKALQSYHQYGLAIDIHSVRKGEITFLSSDKQAIADSKLIGPIGRRMGLEWGGDWKSFKDYPHFQLLPNGKSWRDLKPQLLKIGVNNYKKLTFE